MRGLHGWVRLLERNQTAVLASLIRELDAITASDESSAAQLANAIMKDPSLTTNVLRVANSVQFNQSDIPVTTISRAILNIGFKHIRAICLSLKVLETVLNDAPSDLLLASLAKALHGATQARNLCHNLSSTKQEEVFVASLLSELVPLMIFASSEDDAKAFAKSMELTSTDEIKNRSAEKILGVSISRLSRTLLRQWRIDGIVHEVLHPLADPGTLVQAVLLGAEISRTSLFGWDSPEFKETLRRVADFKALSPENASKLLEASAEETIELVNAMGKSQMGKMIATRKQKASCSVKLHSPAEADKPLLQPNNGAQMKALQELSMSMLGEFNANQVFRLVLTGLHEGAGLERVVFALFNKCDSSFCCKYVIGDQQDRLRDAFVLRYMKSVGGFLHNLIDQDRAAWIRPQNGDKLQQYLDNSIKAITGADEFFIAPLSVNGRKIGIVYADMHVSKRSMESTQFQGFGMFYQQVKLALSILAARQSAGSPSA